MKLTKALQIVQIKAHALGHDADLHVKKIMDAKYPEGTRIKGFTWFCSCGQHAEIDFTVSGFDEEVLMKEVESQGLIVNPHGQDSLF